MFGRGAWDGRTRVTCHSPPALPPFSMATSLFTHARNTCAIPFGAQGFTRCRAGPNSILLHVESSLPFILVSSTPAASTCAPDRAMRKNCMAVSVFRVLPLSTLTYSPLGMDGRLACTLCGRPRALGTAASATMLCSYQLSLTFRLGWDLLYLSASCTPAFSQNLCLRPSRRAA